MILSGNILVMMVGIIMIVLSAFGVQVGPVDLFKMGVAVCFSASVWWWAADRRTSS